jgi:hypothetical protein
MDTRYQPEGLSFDGSNNFNPNFNNSDRGQFPLNGQQKDQHSAQSVPPPFSPPRSKPLHMALNLLQDSVVPNKAASRMVCLPTLASSRLNPASKETFTLAGPIHSSSSLP